MIRIKQVVHFINILTIVEENALNYAELEKGNRKRMKILRINPTMDIPIELLEGMLTEVLDLYRTGIIKI